MKSPSPPLHALLCLVGYLVLCLGSAAALIYFGLPDYLLFLLALPILWASMYYPFVLSVSMLGFLFVMTVLLLEQISVDPPYSFQLLLAASAVTLITSHLISRFTQKRRELEEKLEKAKEHYRVVAEYAADFEFLRTPEGVFSYASPNCVRITGYHNQLFLNTPDLLAQIIHPLDREQVLKCLEYSVDEYSKPMEFRITHRDNTEHWVELSCRQIFKDTGEYMGKRGSIRDITSRKRLEESLLKSTSRLRLAFEGTGDGIWDWDLPSGIVEISPNYARLLDLKTTHLPDNGALFSASIHPDDFDVASKSIKACAGGRSLSIHQEFRVHMPDGEWRWILCRGKVVRRLADSQPVRIVGTFQDITGLKITEETLRQKEEMFRQMTENMSEFFWVADIIERRLIYLSPSLNTLWGYDEEYLNLPGFEIESLFDVEDRPRFKELVEEVIQSCTAFHDEFRIRRADGARRWVGLRGYPIFDAQGKYYRLCGFCEDITSRKEAEFALLHSEERYRELVEKQGEGVLILTQLLTIVFSNPASDHLFGVPDGSLVGRSIRDFLIADDEQMKGLEEHSSRLFQGLESSIELSIERPDQTRRNILVTSTPRFDRTGSFNGSISIFRDITQRKQKEEELRFLSMHDALTGLFNRTYFEQEILRLEDSDLYPVSIIIADLDHLKAINDIHGHSTGDEMLVRAGNVLKKSLRRGDAVARIGGDEFAVLLPATGEDVLQEVIDRVHENLVIENMKQPEIPALGISIGGATSYHRGSLKAISTQADVQMYLHKSTKKLS